eukprot:126248-Chlamydomonas_euryale.AAC.6
MDEYPVQLWCTAQVLYDDGCHKPLPSVFAAVASAVECASARFNPPNYGRAESCAERPYLTLLGVNKRPGAEVPFLRVVKDATSLA